MSIPSPSFDDLFDAFLNELSLSEKPILDCRDEKIRSKAKDVFDQIAASYVSSKDKLKQSYQLTIEIKDITDNNLMKICSLVNEVNKDSCSQEVKDDFAKHCLHLREDILDFKNLISRRSTVDQKGLDFLIDSFWAKSAFKNLLKIKNPWALQKLRQKVDQKDDRWLEILLRDCPQERSLHYIIRDYQEDDELKAYVKSKIETDSDQEDQGFAILGIILSQSECSWAQQYLEDQLDKPNPLEGSQAVIARLFLTCRLKFSWIDELIYKKIEQSVNWAIAMIFNYIDQYSQIMDLNFLDKLISFCRGDKEREHVLTAYAVLVKPTNPFKRYFFKNFKHLKERVIYFEEVNKNLERSDSNERQGSFFNWKNALPYYRVGVMRLLIRRDQQLLDLLTQKISPADFINPAVSDCFPQAHSLLVGQTGGEKYVTELSEILSRYKVPVCFPVSGGYEEEIAIDHDNAYPFYSYSAINRWLRDFSIFHQHSIKIPKVVFDFDRHLTQAVFDFGKERLKERLGLENIKREFEPIATLASDHRQLNFLDALLIIDSSLKELSIQFTYNEGGNVLVGEDQEGPYAIVGKDALYLNKSELSKELAARGLNRDESGNWVSTKPYDPTQCKLDEEDLRLLFACDLGLSSPQRVYFVEQPDFHLDMRCVILSGKRILVNDSIQALDVWRDYASAKLKEAESDPRKMEGYKKRIEALLKSSQNRKVYEDLASQDLEKQGFEVIRIGGVFKDILRSHPELHQINFFNFVSLSAPTNKKVILALGSPKFFQEEFQRIMRMYLPDVDIHFINQEESKLLLNDGGGIHCITKVAVAPFLSRYQED